MKPTSQVPQKRFPLKWYLLAFFLIIFIAGLPFWAVLTAATLAETNGCNLNEGMVNTCMILGADWGEALYALGVLSWFGLITIPLGLLVLGVAVVAFIIHVLVHMFQKPRQR